MPVDVWQRNRCRLHGGGKLRVNDTAALSAGEPHLAGRDGGDMVAVDHTADSYRNRGPVIAAENGGAASRADHNRREARQRNGNGRIRGKRPAIGTEERAQ